jgi:hypothetical protein
VCIRMSAVRELVAVMLGGSDKVVGHSLVWI